MTSTTVNQFRKLFPASVAPSSLLNGKVKIKLKLKSYWGDKTVDELANFVDILNVPGRHLHLYQMRKGCIAVVWLCSITDVKEQKGALWKANHVLLQNMGVLQLLIGEAPVFLSASDSGQTPRADSDRKDYVAGAAVGGVSGGLTGAGVGAVVGAGIGMVVGSVIPGPGTALGLLIGALVGGGIGAVAGGRAGGGIGTGVGIATVAKRKKNI